LHLSHRDEAPIASDSVACTFIANDDAPLFRRKHLEGAYRHVIDGDWRERFVLVLDEAPIASDPIACTFTANDAAPLFRRRRL